MTARRAEWMSKYRSLRSEIRVHEKAIRAVNKDLYKLLASCPHKWEPYGKGEYITERQACCYPWVSKVCVYCGVEKE